jgi:hypothetical protein
MKNTVYALDASTIDLCMSVFPWALFRATKSAVKLHTLLDLRGNIPIFMHISDGKMHSIFSYPKQEPFILWIEVIWILNAFTTGTPLVRIL